MYITNYMHSIYKFHDFLIFKKKPLYIKNTLFSYLLPIEWHLILMSDGSFTQHLYALTGKSIKAKLIINRENKYIDYKKTYIREIWLEDIWHDKLAFAKSIWNLNNVYKTQLPLDKPIGQSFIELKIDIHKEIHEIYYGYCNYLNTKFNSKNAIWGRRYTIYSNKQPLVTIEEFFSPHIIQLFHK